MTLCINGSGLTAQLFTANSAVNNSVVGTAVLTISIGIVLDDCFTLIVTQGINGLSLSFRAVLTGIGLYTLAFTGRLSGDHSIIPIVTDGNSAILYSNSNITSIIRQIVQVYLNVSRFNIDTFLNLEGNRQNSTILSNNIISVEAKSNFTLFHLRHAIEIVRIVNLILIYSKHIIVKVDNETTSSITRITIQNNFNSYFTARTSSQAIANRDCGRPCRMGRENHQAHDHGYCEQQANHFLHLVITS